MKLRTTSTTRQVTKPIPDQKVSWYTKLCRFFGFEKRYNFPLFVIFAGAMLGFVLAKIQYLNIAGDFSKNAAIGEWYWYREGHYRVGITLHLSCCLPAGFLVIWQFIPAIRHRFLLFHRINGYIILVLIFFSNIGVLMIVRRSFGGDVSTQSAVGLLVIMTTISLAMAYINVKKLQIDQHRAWMLRSMFYLGVIITERVLLILSALVTSKIGTYYNIWSCDELVFLAQQQSNDTMGYMQQNFPTCVSSSNSSLIASNQIAVNANLFSSQLENVGSALRMNFGQSLWLAIMMHLIGVEIYLALTPREAQRLRHVSYHRQLEAGMEKPGSAGLVVERFGDADDWRGSKNSEVMLVESE